MSDTIYLHPADAIIDREGDGIRTGMAVLCDEEGNELFAFPGSWTDEQITTALHLANRLYAKGVERGKWNKAYEIRAALDIREPS